MNIKRLFDLEHPFFIPLWRRIAVVALCLGWGTVELTSQEFMWATLFIGLGLYCGWVFFFDFHPRAPEDADKR